MIAWSGFVTELNVRVKDVPADIETVEVRFASLELVMLQLMETLAEQLPPVGRVTVLGKVTPT